MGSIPAEKKSANSTKGSRLHTVGRNPCGRRKSPAAAAQTIPITKGRPRSTSLPTKTPATTAAVPAVALTSPAWVAIPSPAAAIRLTRSGYIGRGEKRATPKRINKPMKGRIRCSRIRRARSLKSLKDPSAAWGVKSSFTQIRATRKARDRVIEERKKAIRNPNRSAR